MATTDNGPDVPASLLRWFLVLELLVFGWVLWETWQEAGTLTMRLGRNVAAYALITMAVGGVLTLPLVLVDRWAVRRHRQWSTPLLAGVVTAIVLGPELILALAHGSLPTRLAQPQLRLVYLAGLLGLFLLGTGLHLVGRRGRWGRWAPGLRVALAGVGLIALTFGLSSLVTWQREPPAPAFAPGERPPHILLVVVDALRPSALGEYGSTLEVSPHLDAMAREGVLFEGCFSVSTTSVPGHAGILFGADVREHLALTNQHDAPRALPSLAESLRERGYRTLGVCRNQLISRRAGFGQGFDFYWSSGRRALDEAPLTFVALSVAPVQIAGQLLDVDWVSLYARAVLRGVGRDRPTFLFLQFLHCHQPYRDGNGWATPDNVARVRQAYRDGVFRNHSEHDDDEVARFHARYLGSVQYVDSLLGELLADLEARGWMEDMVVMVTSDHGENLAEHADSEVGEHGGYYDTSIRIPWLAWGRGLPSGWRSTVLTGHDRIDDVALRLAGEATTLSGRELDELASKTVHFIYSDPHVMALDDSLKVVLEEVDLAVVTPDARVDPHGPLPGASSVFAWRHDVLDAVPLARRDARVVDLWRTVVDSWHELRERGALEPPVSLDPKRLEALRALGYVD